MGTGQHTSFSEYIPLGGIGGPEGTEFWFVLRKTVWLFGAAFVRPAADQLRQLALSDVEPGRDLFLRAWSEVA